MTCDDCELMIAAHAVGGLDPGEDRELRLHLAGCATCQAAVPGYLRTADLLPLALDLETPPPALRSRLLAQVHAEAAGQAVARPARVPLRRRLWWALPSGRGITAAGGLAAIAAVALAVWSFAVPHRTAAPASVLVSRACGLTALPSACGELTYTPATHQTVLSVQGLPSLPEVNHQQLGAYAVWLIQGNGSPALAAYLTAPPNGNTWTAVISGATSTYQAVAMTHEPKLGGTIPTGPELLLIPRPEAPGAS